MIKCDYCPEPANLSERLVVHFDANKTTQPNLCLRHLLICITDFGVHPTQNEENGILYTHHYAPAYFESCARL